MTYFPYVQANSAAAAAITSDASLRKMTLSQPIAFVREYEPGALATQAVSALALQTHETLLAAGCTSPTAACDDTSSGSDAQATFKASSRASSISSTAPSWTTS